MDFGRFDIVFTRKKEFKRRFFGVSLVPLFLGPAWARFSKAS